MVHIKTIGKWRLDLYLWIKAGRIPHKDLVADLVFTKTEHAAVAEFGMGFGERWRQFHNTIAALSAISSTCDHWLVNNNFKNLVKVEQSRREYLGRLIAADALSVMRYYMGSTARIALLFERYVVNDATFTAPLITFFDSHRLLCEKGHIDTETGKVSTSEKGMFVHNSKLIFALAMALNRASPGYNHKHEWITPKTWTYDLLVADLSGL